MNTNEDIVLESGKTYTLIETSFEKDSELCIIKLTLQGIADRTIYGKKHQILSFTMNDHPDIMVWTTLVEGGPTLLEQPLVFQPSNYNVLSENEKAFFRTTFGTVYKPCKPTGYMICKDGDIAECLSRYKEFLENSIIAFKDKIEKMQIECEKRETLYKRQIKWLYNANNLELAEEWRHKHYKGTQKIHTRLTIKSLCSTEVFLQKTKKLYFK